MNYAAQACKVQGKAEGWPIHEDARMSEVTPLYQVAVQQLRLARSLTAAGLWALAADQCDFASEILRYDGWPTESRQAHAEACLYRRIKRRVE